MRSTVHARTHTHTQRIWTTTRLPLWTCSPKRQHQTNPKHQAPSTKHPASSWVYDPLPLPARMAGACMQLQAGLVRVGMPYVCWCGWRGGQEQGEGLRRGKGQQAPTREAVLCPSVDIRTHARTVSAPERPQIDAATGPDTAQLTSHDLLCVQYLSIFLSFCLSICSLQEPSPAVLLNRDKRDTNALTHAHKHTHGRHPSRVYILISLATRPSLSAYPLHNY